MNFMTGLLKTSRGYDLAWIIVNQLTKFAHFLLIKATSTVAQYAKLYLEKIVSLHGVTLFIISY